MKDPWQVKKSEIKYDRLPFIRVTEEEVVRPDGSAGIYSIVTSNDAVHLLPIDEEGNVYMVREYKHGIDDFSIQTVGGYIDHGESPLDAAKREIMEELGIEAKEFISLGLVYTNVSSSNNKMHFFIAKDLKFGKSSPEPTEVIEPYKIKFSEAVKMACDGKIFSVASIALILRANEFLKTSNIQ